MKISTSKKKIFSPSTDPIVIIVIKSILNLLIFRHYCIKLTKKKLEMASNCCYHVHETTVIPCQKYESSNCDCCCSCDELSVARLKNTNHELKHLINKLDDLSVSVDSRILSSHRPRRNSTSFSKWPRCNICEEIEEVSVTRFEYDQVICKKCERMIRLSKMLDEEIAWKKTDSNIYPLDKYPYGSKYYRMKCEDWTDRQTHRSSRTARRSRSKCGCSRSRSNSLRSTSPYLHRSKSRNRTPEPRPNWNGGPYTSSYLWRQWKLVDSKH